MKNIITDIRQLKGIANITMELLDSEEGKVEIIILNYSTGLVSILPTHV